MYPVTRSNDPRTPHHPVLTTGIPWHPRPSQDAVILYQFADYSYDLCPLPDPDVGFSVFVCDVEHILSMLVCAATCLLVQMARLLLKRSRCLAYSAQRAMAYRGISLSWYILDAVILFQVNVAFNIFYQHIVHVDWRVVYNPHLCLCDVHLLTNLPNFI